MENINQWLIDAIEILKAKRIIDDQVQVARALKFAPSTLSNYLAGKFKVSKNFKTKFLESYGPDTKEAWGSGAKERLALKEFKEVSGTPIYEIAATGSGNENTSQLPEVPSYHVTIPGYQDCNFGMHVYGHSMYPTIETGSLVLCRKVNDKFLIMYGEIYLIRTNDYLMVKRLQKSGSECSVLCTSDNFEQRAPQFKRFEPFDLEIDKIVDLYLVKGIIKKTQS